MTQPKKHDSLVSSFGVKNGLICIVGTVLIEAEEAAHAALISKTAYTVAVRPLYSTETPFLVSLDGIGVAPVGGQGQRRVSLLVANFDVRSALVHEHPRKVCSTPKHPNNPRSPKNKMVVTVTQ